MTVEEHVQKIQNLRKEGNEHAANEGFDAVYAEMNKEFLPKIERIATRKIFGLGIGDVSGTVKEITQNFLIKLNKNLCKYDPDKEFYPYAHKIYLSCTIDEIRKQNSLKARKIQNPVDVLGTGQSAGDDEGRASTDYSIAPTHFEDGYREIEWNESVPKLTKKFLDAVNFMNVSKPIERKIMAYHVVKILDRLNNPYATATTLNQNRNRKIREIAGKRYDEITNCIDDGFREFFSSFIPPFPMYFMELMQERLKRNNRCEIHYDDGDNLETLCGKWITEVDKMISDGIMEFVTLANVTSTLREALK